MFIFLCVKGNGRRYEFRLKGFISQSESYVHQFATSDEWENLQVAINEFTINF